jgi:hypothetical protein
MLGTTNPLSIANIDQYHYNPPRLQILSGPRSPETMITPDATRFSTYQPKIFASSAVVTQGFPELTHCGLSSPDPFTNRDGRRSIDRGL